MFYFKTVLVFIMLFFASNLILLQLRQLQKNIRRVKIIERQLLWKIPRLYFIIYTILPNLASLLLFKTKNRLIEEQLNELLNTLSLNLSAGISLIESIKQAQPATAVPLKNELSLFLFINGRSGQLKALEEMKDKSKNVYLKLLWGILFSYTKNGGSLSQNLKNFAHSMNCKINMESRIKGQLIQTKIQMYIGTILPYLLFLVLSLLYPEMTALAMHSGIGQGLFLVAFILHLTGVYFFIIISRFNNKEDMRDIVATEYLAYSLQSGTSILQSFEEISKNNLCSTEVGKAISSSKTSSELIDRLKTEKETGIKYILPVLEKSFKLGIPIASELSAIAENLRFRLEQRAMKFQQTAPTKALIPLFLCIFPATYLLILTPIIVEICSSKF